MGMQETAADYLVNSLAKVNVERIYGVAGTTIFPLLDAIRRHPEVRFIAATNELSAGYMAAYEARLTGGLGVCIATSGPGAAGLASGVADAFFDGDPVLAITGQVKVGEVATRTSQYFEQQTFFKPITGFTSQVADALALAEVFPMAIGTALTERTAVHLSIPEDVLAKPLAVTQPAVRWYPLENLSGNVQAAVDQVASWHRPLLVIGKEAVFAVKEWLALAERLGAAVVVAQEVKGLVAGDHPLDLGGIGETYLPRLLNNIDGIIMIGSAPYEKPFLPRVPTIQITSKTLSLDWSLPLVTPLTGNLPSLARELHRAFDTHQPDQEWLCDIARCKEELRSQLTREAESSTRPVHPSKLMSAMSLHLAEDAIIALDIGAFTHWFDKSFWAKRQTVLTSAYWRGIGAGLPGAIAAKLVFPDRQVIALVGDGGFLLNPGELGTLARYNLKLTVVIANTGSYDLERQKMVKKGISPFGIDLPRVDFAYFAQGFGFKYSLVRETSELDLIIEQALSAAEPVIIDVECAPVKLPHLLV